MSNVEDFVIRKKTQKKTNQQKDEEAETILDLLNNDCYMPTKKLNKNLGKAALEIKKLEQDIKLKYENKGISSKDANILAHYEYRKLHPKEQKFTKRQIEKNIQLQLAQNDVDKYINNDTDNENQEIKPKTIKKIHIKIKKEEEQTLNNNKLTKLI